MTNTTMSNAEANRQMNKRVHDALTAAKAAPFVAKRVHGGCARIYVTIIGRDRKLINAIAANAPKLGLIFQRKAHYGMSNAIYIGYDNADGNAYAKGEAFAAKLNELGIPAYSEAHGD